MKPPTTVAAARPQYRPPTGSEFNLENIVKTGRKLPDRIAVHALQKWGKTSFAAQAPSPIFLMTRGEDGLLTLMKSGELPDNIPHFPKPADTWIELKFALDNLIVHEHPFKTLVLDTFNGAERLCHEYVCQSKYDDSWEKFSAFGAGPKSAVAEIIEVLKRLDRLRDKGLRIICLCHSQVKTFNNPEGPNYDRWEPVLAKETWAVLDRWVDMILFGKFETFSEKETKSAAKGKATGGETRLIMTRHTAAYDAGNRHGLPEEIECGSSAAEAWKNFVQELRSK